MACTAWCCGLCCGLPFAVSWHERQVVALSWPCVATVCLGVALLACLRVTDGLPCAVCPYVCIMLLQKRTLTEKETAQCSNCYEEALQGYENMVKLNELNEPTILHNLRNRYKRTEIYTYVGTILIAVNPFKLLPLYTPQIQDMYKEKVRFFWVPIPQSCPLDGFVGGCNHVGGACSLGRRRFDGSFLWGSRPHRATVARRRTCTPCPTWRTTTCWPTGATSPSSSLASLVPARPRP